MKQYFWRLFVPLPGIESGAYQWQEELFWQSVSGVWPANACLPTGLGKTLVMHLWFLTLVLETLNRL
jgi:hypothetical protein